MSDSIRKFIVDLITEHGPIPNGTAIDDYRYHDTGHIDSLGLIKFLFRIEERFGIQFLPEDIGSGAMRTVGGLVHLIAKKKQAIRP